MREGQKLLFRADRIFAINESWYFSIREQEQEQGPFLTRTEAEKALTTFIRSQLALQQTNPAPSVIGQRCEQGFEYLQALCLDAAWQALATTVTDIGVAPAGASIDLYVWCHQTLCRAQVLYELGDPRVVDLPVPLRDYKGRFGVIDFPADGMLVPGRIYRKNRVGEERHYCTASEFGDVVVADPSGRRIAESLNGLPLNATDVVEALTGRLHGAVA